MSASATAVRHGAYGLAYSGVDVAHDYLGEVGADAPLLSVEVTVDAAAPAPAEEAAGGVVMRFLEGGWATVRRDPLHARLVMPTMPEVADLVHPYLTAVSARAAQWQGWKTMHGGVVSRDGVAVAVVGDREAGKTTLLAACAHTPGLSVMADDLVVVDGDTVYAGPRSLDLRAPTSEAMPHLRTESVRGSSRQRLVLPAPPARSRLVGVVVLGWGAAGLVQLPFAERVGELLPHLPVELNPDSMRTALETAVHPVWRLSRPRDWALLPETVRMVEQVLDSRRGAA